MPTYHLDIVVDGKDRGGSGLLRGIGGLVAGLGKTALVAATGGVLALSGAFGTAIAKGSEFSSVMSAVRADLGPTAAEFEGLSAKALQLGKDTSFGAGDAAAAIDELARNGLNATQILSGAADATVHLAEATGLKGREGLATAATVATDAMANFGIKAENMARAINGISGVAVVSKFDINDYALAMAQAGGVAGAVGVDFEDFNTAIAGISNLFSSGSDAGTSYKTMLQRLVPVSGPAAEAMTKLGIITKEAGNRFFDAQGNLKSMAEVAGILQEAMRGLSEQDAIDLFTTAFGTDAQRAAFGLAKLGTVGFNELAASIAKVDAAAQAATRLDNLAGDMEQLRGSLETAGIEMETAFEPSLRKLVQSATAFVNTNLIGRDWTPLISGVTNAANAVTGFIGQIQAAGGPVAFLRNQLLQFAQAGVQQLQAALPGWVAGLKSWALAAGRWALDAIPDLLINLLELRNQAVGWVLGQVPGWMDALAGWGAALWGWVVTAGPELLARFVGAQAGLVTTIGDGLGPIIAKLGEWGAALWGWVVTAGPELLARFVGAQAGLVTTIGDGLGPIIAKLGEWGAALWSWVEPQIPVLLGKLSNLVDSTGVWIRDTAAPFIGDQLGTWALKFLAWVGPASAELIVKLGELAGVLFTWIAQRAPDILATLNVWSEQFGTWVLQKGIPALGQALLDLASGVWGTIQAKWDAAFQPGTIGTAIVDGIKKAIGDAWGGLVQYLQGKLGELAHLGLSITPAGGVLTTQGANTPGFAGGVTNFRGGLAYVHAGELLVNMPRGTDVLPASATRDLFAGGGGGGSGGFTWTGDLNIQETQNARETARQVRDELIKLGKRNGGDIFGGYA